MKKLICLITALVTLCALCACNNTGDVNTHDHSHNHTYNTTESSPLGQDALTPSEISSDSFVQHETQEGGSEHSPEDSTATQSVEQVSAYPFTIEASGPLMYKHSVKIDILFEQEYCSAESDKERVSVCETYTAKWKTIADRYYREILYYNGSVPTDPNFSTDKEMHSYIEQRKADWEADFQRESADYLERAKAANPDNWQKARALCAAFEFDMQREFSFEMIGIYEMLGEFNNQEF